MDYDEDKVDDAVLAFLYLTVHDGTHAWKGHDWASMDRLHVKGYISNPRSGAKSVVFTEDGEREAARLFRHIFGKTP